MKSARYDDDRLPTAMSFAVEDVFVSAIFSVACDVLANIGEDYKRPNSDVRDLYAWAERFRAGVVDTDRPTNRRGKGLRRPRPRLDRHRDGGAVRPAAVRGLAARAGARAAADCLEGPRFCGHPDLKYRADPVDLAGVQGLPAARVLARAGVAGADVAVLLGVRPPRLVGALADAAPRGIAPGQPTAPSPSTTSRSPVNRWAACSSHGPPRRCWTGWAESQSSTSVSRSSGLRARTRSARSSSDSLRSSSARWARRASRASWYWT